MFPTFRASENGNAKIWQKYRVLFLLAKKPPKQPWNNLCISVPSVSLLVCGVMWISGPGALMRAETSRKSLWGRRSREQCLATSTGCSDREKIESTGRKGIDFSWRCEKMWTEGREALGGNRKAGNNSVILVLRSSHFSSSLKPSQALNALLYFLISKKKALQSKLEAHPTPFISFYSAPALK